MKLSNSQEDIVFWTTLTSPIVGLAFLASKSDGAIRRAGKAGLVTGLVGSTGVGVFAWLRAKTEREEFRNLMEGSAFGAIAGGFGGAIASFAYDAIKSR